MHPLLGSINKKGKTGGVIYYELAELLGTIQ
jgi:hypothetical protein